MAIQHPQRYDDDFINIIKKLIDHVNIHGKTIQDLVADGQLTEEQYSTLITTVNGMLKSGEVDKSDLTPELRSEVDKVRNKIDKGEVSVFDINKNKGKFDQTYLAEELLQQIAGTASINAVPADNSLTSVKYSNKSVTPSKTDFLTSENLFDYGVKQTYKVLNTLGELSNSSSYDTTDYIPIENGKTYSLSKGSRWVSAYNGNKDFVETVTDTARSTQTYTFTATTDGFIRVSIYQASVEGFTVVEGSMPKEIGREVTFDIPINLPNVINSIGKGEVTDYHLSRQAYAVNMYSDETMTDTSLWQTRTADALNVETVSGSALKFTNPLTSPSTNKTISRAYSLPMDDKNINEFNVYFNVDELVKGDGSTDCRLIFLDYDINGSEIIDNRQIEYITAQGTQNFTHSVSSNTFETKIQLDFYLLANKTGNDTITISDFNIKSAGYTIFELIENNGGGAPSELSDKIIHFSVDDVVGIFEDLTNNGYTSIFNQPSLSFFKQVHDAYGAVFSLYCFYENSTFDLSQSAAFVSEFEENADWLKVGFHARNSTSNYTSDDSQALTDYNDVISELVRICGAKSIDRIPRIHFYAGTLNAVNSWKNANNGIVGLLSADDTRNSYYHNDAQRDYLEINDELFDGVNAVHFVSTDIRLENYSSVAEVINTINAMTNNKEKLILFTHENRLSNQDYLDMIQFVAAWGKNKGYAFEYPMNKMKLDSTL